MIKYSSLMSVKQARPVLSLNVNGLGNPVKQSKIIIINNKLKKEETLVNFLQETHLSEAEHLDSDTLIIVPIIIHVKGE